MTLDTLCEADDVICGAGELTAILYSRERLTAASSAEL